MNIPHKFPTSLVSPDPNIYAAYHRTSSPDENKPRSGILERYIYKTDSGELLPNIPGPDFNKIRVRSRNDLFGNQRTPTKPVVTQCDTSKTEFIDTIRNKIKNKLMHSTNKVQTEHCDSTTDLETLADHETVGSQCDNNLEVALFTDDTTSNIYDSPCRDSDDESEKLRIARKQVQDDHSFYTLPPVCHNYSSDESDSDCQIIEIDKPGCVSAESVKNNNKISMIDTSKTSIVISDSDSESETLLVKKNCTKWYRNVSKNKESVCKTNDFDSNRTSEIIEKSAELSDVEMSYTDSPSSNETDNGTSVYEIFNGIKITLPPSHTCNMNKTTLSNVTTSTNRCVINNNSIIISKKNIFDTYLLKDTAKSDIIDMLSKPSTSYIKSVSQQPDTTTKFTDKTSKHDVTRNELTPTKAFHKMDTTLSPESRKSEFYSYLKINTNPLAQKAEIVAQNRRSNRVKNLISQNEKLKEKNQKDGENKKAEPEESKKKKIIDVRAKYLKYSKKEVKFPRPPIECRRNINFKQSIEAYFIEEDIEFDKKLSEKTGIFTNNCKVVLQRNEFIEYSTNKILKNKIVDNKSSFLYRTRVLKQINEKMDGTKTRDKILKIKKNNSLKKKLKYKNLRLSTNRILRNASRPMTRYAVKDHILLKKSKRQKGKLNDKHKTMKEKLNKSFSKDNKQDAQKTEREMNSESLTSQKQDVSISYKGISAKFSNQIDEKKIENSNEIKQNLPKIVPDQVTEKKLSSVDKFEMITQSYLAEHPLEQTRYCMEEGPYSSSPVASQILDGLIDSSSTSTSKLNNDLELDDDETPENQRKVSNSPQCIGFVPDDTIVKIRKGIQNILKTQFIQEDAMIQSNADDANTDDTGGNNDILQQSINDSSQNSYEKRVDEHPIIVTQTSESIVSPPRKKSLDATPETPKSKDNTVVNSEELLSNNPKNPNYIPLNPNVKLKSFHRSLLTSKRKIFETPPKTTMSFPSNSSFNFEYLDNELFSPKTTKTQSKKDTHEIDIDKTNGPVFNAYYVNYTLIIVQECLISFWRQTPLGNILGAQNMWLAIGNIQRLTLERGCTNRRSSEMIFNLENSVAYIELWTKEHKSAFRERPIADVFATIYYHKGHGTPDKKVLQLENIKGFGNDVRFAVVKNSREIIVSWCDTFSKPMRTLVRSYELAADFQTVSSIKEMESVSHYVSSLHNIGDCDTLVLGADNEHVFIWNLAHGWLVSTVSLTEAAQPALQTQSICLWAHCDNGFLFLLQQIGIGVLRLVAVNGMTNEWKQLQTYRVPECYLNLLGVAVESGILMTCYTNGFLCWDMQSGQLLADTETPSDQIVLPSNKYLVSIDNFQVTVKHVMAYLLTND